MQKQERITATIRLNKSFAEWFKKNEISPTEFINNVLEKNIHSTDDTQYDDEEKTYFVHYHNWKELQKAHEKALQELQIGADIVRARAKKIAEKKKGKQLFPEIVEGYDA